MARSEKSHTAASGLHCTKSVVKKNVEIASRKTVTATRPWRYHLFGAIRKRKKATDALTNGKPIRKNGWVTKLSLRPLLIFDGGLI